MKAINRIEVSSDVIKRIGTIADDHDVKVYLVGGYVRDLLLGKTGKDIDVVVLGDAVDFAGRAAAEFGISGVVTYERFGTAMLTLDEWKIEFVSAREESYERSSRKPSVKSASLESDLSRRDFTINAMAVSINKEQWGKLVDPYNGRDDLDNKILRTPLDPEKTFDDDPLRMLRAVRFASQLHCKIEKSVYLAIQKMSPRLEIVSKERITDEFFKILRSSKPSVGLNLIYETGLMRYVFPELLEMVGVEQRKDHHHKDVFAHTLKVVDAICKTSENIWLRFVALVHDIAKPRTKAYREDVGWTFHGHEEVGARMMKSIFRRMRLPLDKLEYVEKLVRLHLRPMVLVSEEVSDSAIRRLMFEAGENIDDLMLLCRADITSQNPQRVSRYLRNYDEVIKKMKEVEEKDRIRNWQPPVKGDEIMEVCGIKPGRLVGVLKKKIEDAILDGQIPNEHDTALSFLLSIKDKIINEYSE
jgi:putative nucleotidyltransferase with HDIG domain